MDEVVIFNLTTEALPPGCPSAFDLEPSAPLTVTLWPSVGPFALLATWPGLGKV